jgi:hypothetical protein
MAIDGENEAGVARDRDNAEPVAIVATDKQISNLKDLSQH